jgi:RNA-binding protein NOB1
MIHFLNNKIEF